MALIKKEIVTCENEIHGDQHIETCGKCLKSICYKCDETLYVNVKTKNDTTVLHDARHNVVFRHIDDNLDFFKSTI